MPEKELLEQFNVSICEFSSNEWSRNGFIDPINRVVYINGDLSPETRLKVILHELGHLEHNSKDYERLREKYEAQANRNMIHELLVDYLKSTDIYDFNWVRFAAQYDISTTWGEAMIQDEFRKIQQTVI
ncbi:peptidase [Streptococcus salivarius]|uniref:ImmA/IrrE family metallo-endopeptidase n=1 Tax=Streptococcus salivarius TaxID=1304 RepID=UPI000BC75BBA|nr:ImmA/IrrE family metallo-endopeptidase [Streptococcus salivarius]PCR83397.1 peptidase [Streptococcus salivarius]